MKPVQEIFDNIVEKIEKDIGGKMKTEEVLKERGGNYGTVEHHFTATVGMFETFKKALEESEVEIEHIDICVIRHGVYMILDKLARASWNPYHADNWQDIIGYATLVKKHLEEK